MNAAEVRRRPRGHAPCDARAAGQWNPLWDLFAELDPDWTGASRHMGLKPMMSGRSTR